MIEKKKTYRTLDLDSDIAAFGELLASSRESDLGTLG
jgi:hypothetical protein